MTKHQKPRNISIDDGWTIEVPSENGVERRTLVKGAAWSVPIIATAGATPAFAASPTPTLAFTQSSYSGTGCGTITGVQVKRTVDGTAPDAGKTVSVTLADGYTFADGTTTYSGTTDANGLITLPDIKVPAKGGNSKFSASSDTLAASATVSGSTNGGDLYNYNGTSSTATGAKNIAQVFTDGTGNVYAVTKDGDLVDSAGNKTQNGVTFGSGLDASNTRGTAISGANADVYYIKNGDLYKYSNGAVTATGAKNIAQVFTDGTGNVYAVTKDGDLVDSVGNKTQNGVTFGSGLDASNTRGTAISGANADVYYIKNGDLYKYSNGAVTATGATNIAQVFTDGTGNVYAVTKDGDLVDSVGNKTQNGVTFGSGLDASNTRGTAISGANADVYYIKNGDLYKYSNGAVTATGATNIAQVFTDGTGNVYAVTKDGDLVDSVGKTVNNGVTFGSGLDASNTRGTAISGANGNVYYIKAPTC
ncbi:hypothetical protein [Rathayibacter toxicus]|nr:hypothetical protein [Rathayibacter toxicus]QWL31560.1 hypothetical protein E2R35_00945 [Rathayibacter toxicus]QWL33652.1 hypothetical protein E2R36_00945 [Rathayibacter toxicus]QWL35787.1 hypothetical protein E2R37_00945 [Rathayibacter toxicus]QWL37876.1 hypothetical protein E2R38_00945 [Rathayibacter toxicus]QWL39966.1 hypothetical protein E2R39_00945 [Rathayibacter toxicus]